jgi:hypothetical protein
VARYPDLDALARLSKQDFSDIGSLDMISRRPKTRFEAGYPANGTPEWWALRKRYEELLFSKIRAERAASHMPCRVNEPEAEAAKWAALGNETADRDYQQFSNVPMDAPDYIGARRAARSPDWLQASAAKALGKVA